MKKILSLLLSIVMIVCSLSAFAISADAASFSAELKAKGFPDSYISSLVTLHEKYPNWNFEVFNTGLKWSDAVSGERSPHSKQLIQKSSSLGSAYYCNCSSCYKNGSYVPQEGSTWISASEKAVKYYMDPRNWLSEKYIFQFESTSYDSTQTQSGVESIIASTWMKNSNISYVNTSGSTVTYKNSSGNTVKYSAAILSAAKNSGMSAYYLASKIVQEVGGSKPTAGGAVGTRLPFKGIYNYYNIGAYAGASDGLAWAAGFLKSTKATTLYSSYDSTKKAGSGTKTSVKANQYMTYIGTYGDYYKVRLYNELGSNSYSTNGAVGYILKSALRTTYFNYGRPWTSPYKAIYYGATYIANSFSKYQNTGYLQKFNVNKSSGSLYNHEYMANVQAASLESVTTYNAYNKAGILSSSKTFYIPVYSSMPSSKCTMSSSSSTSSSSNTTTTTASSATTAKVTGLTLKSRTTTSMKFTWTKVSGATKYYVYIKNNTKGTNFNKTVTTNSATISGLTAANEYSVKVRAYTSKGGWGAYSSVNTKHALPGKVTGLKASARTTSSITLKWTKMAGADGYYIYRYSGGKYTKIKTIKSGKTVSAKITGLKAGTNYVYAVAAYTADASTKTGSKSSKLTACSKPATVTAKKLTSPSKTKLKLTWNKVSGSATGYQIYYARDKAFKNVVAKKFVSGQSKVSYTGKNFTKGRTYYVKVRAYKTVNGTKYYGAWSKTLKVKSK
ncbi:MAG: fibronectin type III domain-containing protein [Eubacterium sp.]